MPLEEMRSFFNLRSDEYDRRHIENIDGHEECYHEIPKYLPKGTKTLIDFGCGTGLELDSVFKMFPDMCVTGIDLAEQMIERLNKKFDKQNVRTIVGDYFRYDFGMSKFDAALSVLTLHHFSHEEKQGLFERIRGLLNDDGVYIDCDYMVEDESQENYFRSENDRLRKEMGITGGYYHYDTPCSVDNEMALLKNAGFSRICRAWNIQNTVIIVAWK